MANMKVSERLKVLRKQRKITQRQLADMMGKSVITISTWERGVRIPTEKTIRTISDMVGESAEDKEACFKFLSGKDINALGDMMSEAVKLSGEKESALLVRDYKQTKRRCESLERKLLKIEIGTLEEDIKCPVELLKKQRNIMGEYLHILALRIEYDKVGK